MKRKILHVTGAMNIGGTETMLINLYRKVNKKIEFHFISYSKEEAFYDKEIERLGGKVIRLEPPSEVGFISAIRDIRNIIKENGAYDAVHTHMLFNCGIAMIAAYLCGIKVRISHSHTTSDDSTSFIRRMYINFMRVLIRIFSTDFLACSNLAGKYLFGSNIMANKRYKVLPNYIDYEKFINNSDKSCIREELGINKDDILLCHVGRFITAKNHEFLIDMVNEMIKKNDNVKLILVGDGDLKVYIENKVKAIGIEENVYFMGIRNDIPSILKNIDLFILPSIYEGLGLVLLEAQASKVPCLVSEAIQPEVDLGVGLVKQFNLSDGAIEWANEANKIIKENKVANIDIIKSVKEKKYDLNSILDNLLSVYKFKLD